MPHADIAKSKPDVALFTASACFTPTYSANSLSKAAFSFPVVSQPERIMRKTACSSSSPIEGKKKGTGVLSVSMCGIVKIL